jgi:hypothetical protein
MVAMILAVAVTGGASLSAAGSGILQKTLHALGVGRDSAIQAEQRKHAAAIADMERIISRMDNEIGGLGNRMAHAEQTAALAGEAMAKADGALAAVAEIKDLRLRADSAGGDTWRKPVEHLNAAVTGTRSDIINLRSSIDAYDQLRRSDVGALARRLERVEQTLAARDVTASVPSGTSSSRRIETPAANSGVMEFLGLRGNPSDTRGGHVIDMSSPVQ